MIPDASIDTDLTITDETETDKTYKISGTVIQGFIDGMDALQQAIFKVLDTEKYEYPIYSFDYGIELDNLIGKDPTYVQLELKRRITECLLADDRVQNVDNFTFTATGDELLCTFDVESIYGTISVTKEVAA